METQIVVSALGQDRPGIVHRLSEVILKHGGNITVQRSIKLGGDFAVLLLFTVETKNDDALAPLFAALESLEDDHLQVVAKRAAAEAQGGEKTWELNVTGADQPGIINTLTLFLMDQGINIRSMDYTIANGPFTAAPLFNAGVLFTVPSDKDQSEVEEGLRNIEEDLDIDIKITPPA